MKTSDKIKNPTFGNDDPVLVSHEFLIAMSNEVVKLEEALHQDVHVIVFSDDSWCIQHLVECRPDMTKCEIHKRAQTELVGTDAGLRGKFKVSILDGVLDFEKIDD